MVFHLWSRGEGGKQGYLYPPLWCHPHSTKWHVSDTYLWIISNTSESSLHNFLKHEKSKIPLNLCSFIEFFENQRNKIKTPYIEQNLFMTYHILYWLLDKPFFLYFICSCRSLGYGSREFFMPDLSQFWLFFNVISVFSWKRYIFQDLLLLIYQ